MTPSARRAGIVTGLVLSMVCALGFAHRSSGEIAAQCRAETEAREAREAELEAQRAERAAEMDAVNRRIAMLESDLARERELREAAEGRAVEAAKPQAEAEAVKAELERAYARIGELERGVGEDTWGNHARILKGKQVDGELGIVSESAVVEEGTEATFELEPDDEPRIRSTARVNRKVRVGGPIVIGDVVVTEGEPVVPAQRFEGGLNQGIDYVDPADLKEKLEEIRKILVEAKQIRREGLERK